MDYAENECIYDKDDSISDMSGKVGRWMGTETWCWGDIVSHVHAAYSDLVLIHTIQELWYLL